MKTASYFCGPCEGNLVHVQMLCNGCTGCWTVPRNNIYDTRWVTSLTNSINRIYKSCQVGNQPNSINRIYTGCQEHCRCTCKLRTIKTKNKRNKNNYCNVLLLLLKGGFVGYGAKDTCLAVFRLGFSFHFTQEP